MHGCPLPVFSLLLRQRQSDKSPTKIMSSFCLISSISFLSRSSNSPRYLVPATSRPMSSVMTCAHITHTSPNESMQGAEAEHMLGPRHNRRGHACMFFKHSGTQISYAWPVNKGATPSNCFTCLPSIVSGTSPFVIFCAKPSATAVLPTPCKAHGRQHIWRQLLPSVPMAC